MSENNSSAASSAIGLPTLLTVVFVVLKLCHVIDWSWWWVLSPIWIEIVLSLIFLIVVIVVKYHALKHSRERFINHMEQMKQERNAIIEKQKKL